MFLAQKIDFSIQIWEILEVNGRITFERAHAGEDYKFFEVDNKSNIAGPRKILIDGFDAEIFNTIEEAITFVNESKNAYIDNLKNIIKNIRKTKTEIKYLK